MLLFPHTDPRHTKIGPTIQKDLATSAISVSQLFHFLLKRRS
jgi:hypothetical protein